MTSEQIDVKRRDFDADLALCEAAGNLNWIRNLTDVDADAMFIAAARDGWLAALRRIKELEAEVVRLRDAIDDANEVCRRS